VTGAVLERPAGLFDAAPGGVTLEDLLNGALDEALTKGSTECPVCHARMTYTRASAAAGAGSADCSGCGTVA
jgi:hypothetical protein